MTITVKKIGGSAAVVIPKGIARGMHLAEGSTLEISATDNAIIMRKPRARARRSLASIINLIRPASYKRRRRELGDDGPFRSEVIDRCFHHLTGVEVTLREHEGPCGGATPAFTQGTDPSRVPRSPGGVSQTVMACPVSRRWKLASASAWPGGRQPMGARSRWGLSQDSPPSVANSTRSLDFHGLRRRTILALRSRSLACQTRSMGGAKTSVGASSRREAVQLRECVQTLVLLTSIRSPGALAPAPN